MKLLAIEQISEMLNVSTRQVWRLRDMGKMPMPVKLGKCVRWRDEEMAAWIAAGCPDVRRTKWTPAR
jgi:predicted DNA-binding transcriptional regulator AlpA